MNAPEVVRRYAVTLLEAADETGVAEAVQRVIPPDQSAAMAHAAWDVATQSAAVMDQLVDAILLALDERALA